MPFPHTESQTNQVCTLATSFVEGAPHMSEASQVVFLRKRCLFRSIYFFLRRI
jgi:hypothetical protein